MTVRTSPPDGAPNWVDLVTSDMELSRNFYTRLFGWTAETGAEEYGGYVTFYKDGDRVGGMAANNEASGMPDTWSTYLAVADAAATAAAVQASGGQVLMGPMQVGTMGTVAVFLDAGQAVIGAWQPGENRGYQRDSEPGTPCWHELLTRDYETAVRFYEDAFGWNTSVMSDTDDFRYTTLGAGDDARAGIMDAARFLPEGVPAGWQTYWGSSDVDAMVATALELGGRVTEAPQDTPFGRVAELIDCTGARLRIISA